MGQATSSNKEYMQTLKEICEKDPINATYVTTYINLLVQGRSAPDFNDPASQGTNNSANPEQNSPQDAIAEAQKVFESSLRYNAS